MATQRELQRLRRAVEEEWEFHEASANQDPDEFARYADDPVGFIREILGAEPWEKQVEIAEAVRDNQRVVVRSAHDMGKDWLLARLLLWNVYARGGLSIYTAPTDRQLEIGMREVRSAFRKSALLAGELFSRSLRVGGEDRLMAFTSTSVDNLTGWHDPNGVMVGISEGQGERVEDVVYDAAFALVTGEKSRLLVGGNPIRPYGRFFEINRKASWVPIKIAAADHPNIRAGKKVVPYGPSPEWPAQIAAEYGRGHPYYIARVLAEFPEDAIESLFKLEWIDRSFARWREKTNAGADAAA